MFKVIYASKEGCGMTGKMSILFKYFVYHPYKRVIWHAHTETAALDYIFLSTPIQLYQENLPIFFALVYEEQIGRLL